MGFVKEMASRVHCGKRVTSTIQEQFKPIVHEAILAIINDRINDRLKSAIEAEDKIKETSDDATPTDLDTTETNGIETTAEELEGLYIVRAICARAVEPARLIEKDTKTYFAILLDGNTWKTVIRLYFNGVKKRLEIFDEAEPKFVEVKSASDVYNSTDRILSALNKRLNA